MLSSCLPHGPGFNAAAACAESNESTDDADVDESPVRLERRYRWSNSPVGFMTIHVFHPVVFPSRRDWKLSDVEIGCALGFTSYI